MLNTIIRFSLNNRFFVLICTLLLVIVGTYNAANMEIDVFPDLNAPTVVIMTEAKGMASEEVERLVTFPIETSVNGATDVRRIRSSSTTGFSIVWVEFNWGTDIFKARQIVSERISMAKEELPSGTGMPTLGPQSSILGELMIIGLSSETQSMEELRTIADWVIRPQLLTIGGVAQVSIIGGDIKEYQLLLNPEKMKYYDTELPQILASVNDMNKNISGGIMYDYGNEYIIRAILSTDEISQLKSTVVKNSENKPILLENIADVRIGNKTPKLGIASVNGEDAVLITITKQPNTSTLELTKTLDLVLDDIKTTIPENITLTTDIFRQSHFINHSINNIKTALYQGAFFVVLVLFIFLMNYRTTIISLITIPLSLLVSILMLKIMGLTINTMSLGGMAIAIGSLVDDAIVDVENVYKRLKENRKKPKEEQLGGLQVVFNASKEIRIPILNSTFIIVASFIPLFFLSGIEGRMLAPLGIAFITALFASTFVALTLTPVLCSYFLTKPISSNKEKKEPYVTRKITEVYHIALLWALSHKKWVIGGTSLLFIGAIVIFFTLGRSFLPPFNEGSFTIEISTLPGISLEESDKIGKMAENILLEMPEITTVGRKTGRAELDEHALGVNTSEIEAPFILKNRSKDALMSDLRERLKVLPGVNIEIGQPISHRIDAMLSGTKTNIAIKIFGNDLNRMFSIGKEIESVIDNIEGLTDLNVEQQIERPQLKITPKRHMLMKYGASLPEFAEIIQVMLSGEIVSQVYENNKIFDLTLKVDPEYINSIEKIKNLYVDINGHKTTLGNIAEISSSAGPTTINRENSSRKVVVSANVAGRDLRGVVSDIQKNISSSIQLPEGYRIEYGGQFENEQEASRILLISSIFSILVIFMLLFFEFKNFTQSALILLNLPLALIGGIFAIYFTDGIISIPAIIGFISLFGIATRNGMLLVLRYNDLRDKGVPLSERIIQGSLDRLNPILMTALTSALALIPLALGGELPGNEIESPMAKVLLGGLLSSTLLNGFIIPILSTYIGDVSKKRTNTTILQ